jgi:hypothetical protein
MKLLTLGVAVLASTTAVVAQTCNLPSTYKWTSSGALAQPKNGWVSLKDCMSTIRLSLVP